MVSAVLSKRTRQGILNARGTMSKMATAREFNTSPRTVGRLWASAVHAIEDVQPKPVEGKAGVEALTAQVKALEKLVEELSTRLQGSANPQRLRQEPNPVFDVKPTEVHGNDFSSPYRDSAGMKIKNIYGVDVPVHRMHCDSGISTSDWFKKRHPASPYCTRFPYAGLARTEEEAQGLIFLDPAPGAWCDCGVCGRWRQRLADEEAAMRAREHAAHEHLMYHAAKYRR